MNKVSGFTKKITIFTDGGSRGNPGVSGAGIYVENEFGECVFEIAQFLGIKTNNEAEYQAFLKSAQWLQQIDNDVLKEVEWKLDSKLVVEQLNKNWKIKQDHLRELATRCWEILHDLPYSFKISHVRREKNKHADLLANQAMDSYSE